MPDQPNDYPAVAPRQTAPPTPTVSDAFMALDLALHAAGAWPNVDIDRVTAYRRSLREVARRWRDGEAPPVMRPKKPTSEAGPEG